MPQIPKEILHSLQFNTKNIRNICILAHVDHGKTTLSDSLISTNGIISQKLAGKIKYLDNRPDEIEREITMKSSCISLLHIDKSKTLELNTVTKDNSYIIHLIDSPGHVDFSSEVSTAVRLSDGALVLVDVLEGVCIQTIAVIKQAFSEKVKPCLVINKIDRLITELKLTPQEAYERIQKVLEQVNNITGTLFSIEYFKQMDQIFANQTNKHINIEVNEENIIDWNINEEESELYFSPERGNVVFSSAIDGWGFRIDNFSELYSKKLGVKKEILQKTLWGNFFFDNKSKKIYKKNKTGKMSPMFVQFVLQNIWEVYNSVLTNDKIKIEKIINALKLNIPPRELLVDDPKMKIQSIFSRWLPLASTILQTVVEHLPSPLEAQQVRISKLWQLTADATSEITEKQKEILKFIQQCNKDSNVDVIIFVSKVFTVGKDAFIHISKVPPKRIQHNNEQDKNHDKDNEENVKKIDNSLLKNKKTTDEKFIAFSRIFSGTLKKGMKVHILGPRYNPLIPNKHHLEMEVNELYLLMGRALEPIDEIPAGNIFGIGGVEKFIVKTATISTTPLTSPFNSMSFFSSPIVRVAVEAENPSEMPKLIEGLKILNQADPCVEIIIQESGEHVIVASGELHLERCLKDLRDIYAKIPIRVSPPLVSFRETIKNELNLKYRDLIKDGFKTSNKRTTIKMKAISLPNNIIQFLFSHSNIIKRIFVDESVNLQENIDVNLFRENLIKEFKEAGGNWLQHLDHLWSFGPRKIGPNILLNYIPNYCDTEYWFSLSKKMKGEYETDRKKKKIEQLQKKNIENEIKDENKLIPIFNKNEITELEKENENSSLVSLEEKIKLLQDLDNSIISGFLLATASGPLCEEPMMGVCFILEDIIFEKGYNEKVDIFGPFSGQIISTMKEACRQTFLSHSVRLMEPLYLCDIQIPSEYMGKVYPVLGKRRAKIQEEDIKETGIVSIKALLPVIESFGFAEEILKQTSGAASSQLIFSHWELLDKDPFFVATTEEELEDIGYNLGGVAPNIARIYVDSIRRRKGLKVEEQIVKHADKQRTLKKNK